MTEYEVFKSYVNAVDVLGVVWFDDIYISSNSYYVFFKDIDTNKVIAMFSKKYFITVELVLDKKKRTFKSKLKDWLLGISKSKKDYTETLEKISGVIEEYRKEKGLTVSEYEYWIPHCIVDGKELATQFVASSYGVSRELALEYLIQYDHVFNSLYDTETNLYLGLPLMNTFEEANRYPLKENNKYKKEYRKFTDFLA